MRETKIVSIVPYKILPAKLGGEKGIALFNEYVGERIPITAISTRNNDPQICKKLQATQPSFQHPHTLCKYFFILQDAAAH